MCFPFLFPLLQQYLCFLRFFFYGVDNRSQNVVCVPHESEDLLMQRCVEQGPCNFEHRGCDICLSTLNYTRHAVEPVMGIELPATLENGSDGETNSNWLSEVVI